MPININNLHTLTRAKLLDTLKEEYTKLNLPPAAARADLMKRFAKFGLSRVEVNTILDFKPPEEKGTKKVETKQNSTKNI